LFLVYHNCYWGWLSWNSHYFCNCNCNCNCNWKMLWHGDECGKKNHNSHSTKIIRYLEPLFTRKYCIYLKQCKWDRCTNIVHSFVFTCTWWWRFIAETRRSVQLLIVSCAYVGVLHTLKPNSDRKLLKTYNSMPDSVLGAATRLRCVWYRCARLFLDNFSASNKERHWGPPCLLCKGYLWIIFPGVKRPVREFTIDLYVVPRIRTRYTFVHLRLHGAGRDNFILHFYVFFLPYTIVKILWTLYHYSRPVNFETLISAISQMSVFWVVTIRRLTFLRRCERKCSLKFHDFWTQFRRMCWVETSSCSEASR
jgi:hypothetical protein